jgi:hypothetical protein
MSKLTIMFMTIHNRQKTFCLRTYQILLFHSERLFYLSLFKEALQKPTII